MNTNMKVMADAAVLAFGIEGVEYFGALTDINFTSLRLRSRFNTHRDIKIYATMLSGKIISELNHKINKYSQKELLELTKNWTLLSY